MKVLNKIELEEEGILTIHGVVAMLPTEEQIDKLAETWCDERAESWNAQKSAYIEGMTAIVDALKELTKGN